MKIYSMTATFGKLEHQTLTLTPGLNVIHAPNEWGKSTWCAFLLNMLYGVDTKERTKQDALADKDRYAPWSGAAMSGRIELNWNGRDITIERSSSGRIPLGVFRAYETETGLDIPELTAGNCGQILLGVERNVFTRAGFLKLTDMPVTQDEALRRRLNNLVTTGDESGDADKLGQALKDLKNKCRANRANGLLPEAEAQREQLRNQLWDLQELSKNAESNQLRQQELEQSLTALTNHLQVLEYEASRENARRIQEANDARDTAAQKLSALTAACETLPTKQETAERLRRLEQLQLQKESLDTETVPAAPEAPQAPAPFIGMDGDHAMQQANADKNAYEKLGKKSPILWVILTILSALAGAALLFINPMAAIPCVALAIVFFALCLRSRASQKKGQKAIVTRYGSSTSDEWIALASRYQAQTALYEEQLAARNALMENLAQRKRNWENAAAEVAQASSLEDEMGVCANILSQWDALETARQDWQQADRHASALAAVSKAIHKPEIPDNLTLTEAETQAEITKTQFELKQLQLQLGQFQGQMDALGHPSAIQAQLDLINQRIRRLESYYSAIELAQDAMYKATLALQRRFSPRITKRAQTLFGRLTGNRYTRITMREDMSLEAAAENEDTLRELRRRSDGTVDQLYLALRLALAEELMPEAPLILDDALVRFDDDRLSSAMEILKETSQQKQVILFTCQGRESAYLS